MQYIKDRYKGMIYYDHKAPLVEKKIYEMIDEDIGLYPYELLYVIIINFECEDYYYYIINKGFNSNLIKKMFMIEDYVLINLSRRDHVKFENLIDKYINEIKSLSDRSDEIIDNFFNYTYQRSLTSTYLLDKLNTIFNYDLDEIFNEISVGKNYISPIYIKHNVKILTHESINKIINNNINMKREGTLYDNVKLIKDLNIDSINFTPEVLDTIISYFNIISLEGLELASILSTIKHNIDINKIYIDLYRSILEVPQLKKRILELEAAIEFAPDGDYYNKCKDKYGHLFK